MSAAVTAVQVTAEQGRPPTRWVTAEVLRVLAVHPASTGHAFTGRWLARNTTTTLTTEQRHHATTRLVGMGFLQHRVVVLLGKREDEYTLTAEGAAAVDAAALGNVRKSGPKGRRTPNPVRPGDVASRLWQLMRMRTVLDSDTAARTLCNAGDPDFDRLRATVRRTLRRWELAGALQAGAKRVATAGQAKQSNGSKRYVLINDTGPTPPRWHESMRLPLAGRAVNQGGAT